MSLPHRAIDALRLDQLDDQRRLALSEAEEHGDRVCRGN
jgi:hypothetical protein